MNIGMLVATTVALAGLLALAGCDGSASADLEPGGASAAPVATAAAASQPQPGPAAEIDPEPMAAPSLLDRQVNRIDGTAVSLADYQGRVLLIVNTASKCGYTRQYAGLQKLHETYADRGLAVMGFPANNFGGQEPGTNLQIISFCQDNFGVSFDMFEKVSVKGADQHPLFADLTAVDAAPAGAGDIKWNFEKFLIGRDGRVLARYRSKAEPDDPEMLAAIESALNAR